MIRIIGGEAKGRAIEAPGGVSTRPTRAIVREAMFGMLQSAVQGSRVLDLFAGSGALGLEALSRGAERAVFADKDIRAISIVKRNLSKLGFSEKASIFCGTYDFALRKLMTDNALFDIILLDPPYNLQNLEKLPGCLAPVAARDAILVLEHANGVPIHEAAPWEYIKMRKYGDTSLSVFHLNGG